MVLFNCTHVELAEHLLSTHGPEMFDALIIDPPWGRTSLVWDKWPAGWPRLLLPLVKRTGSMWAIGNLKMWWEHVDEFKPDWLPAEDAIWKKHNGSNGATDRLRRVHEQAIHFYRADSRWKDVYQQVPVTFDAKARRINRHKQTPHTNPTGPSTYETKDGGPRLLTSVREVRSCHGFAVNECQKPADFITTLAEMSCPPGGLMGDFFAGSGVLAVVAAATGRRFMGCELRAEQCEATLAMLELLHQHPELNAHQVMVEVGKARRRSRAKREGKPRRDTPIQLQLLRGLP